MYKLFTVRIIFFIYFFITAITLIAQPVQPPQEQDQPTDYLSATFHAGRRAALREIMPANSVMVVFAFPTRTFSNDIDYFYHPNPDMYYFSGYKEPHAVLFIFKSEQHDSSANKFNELLFVQKKNPQAEQWTGKRLGTEGVKEKLGISKSYNGEEFKNTSIDFTKFDKIIFDRFPIDIPNSTRDNADLYDLVQQFKQKSMKRYYSIFSIACSNVIRLSKVRECFLNSQILHEIYF